MKNFSDKQKLKEFVINKLDLQDILREVVPKKGGGLNLETWIYT